MWKLSEVLLNYASKETNTTSPHSDYITPEKYPEQNHSLVNTVITLEFDNNYKCNVVKALSKPAVRIVDGEKISLRPHDDHQFINERVIPDPDGDLNHDTWEDDFLILRADMNEPNVLIAISLDFSILLVSSTKINDMGHFEFIDNVAVYPIQYNEFFNTKIKTHYMDENFINDQYLEAEILRIDKTEPCKIVLMEYINKENNEVRFVLGDEVTAIYEEKSETYVNDASIADYRKNLLEGKIIYG